MKTDLPCITDILMQKLKLDVSRFAPDFLEKTIRNRIGEHALDSVRAYCTLLNNSTLEANKLYTALNNNYSEFFRHSLTFSVLEHLIIPELIRTRLNNTSKEIRIWSAACAAGQEAYSIAMLFEEFKSYKDISFSYRIFASDINEKQIEIAQKGVFHADAMNQLNGKRLSTWFEKHHEQYFVNEDLKKSIEFSVFDLFSESYCCPPASIFGDFDLIICANLMFYYTHANQKYIIDKISKCLSPDGFFITGDSERDLFMRLGYNEFMQRSAIFKKRTIPQ